MNSGGEEDLNNQCSAGLVLMALHQKEIMSAEDELIIKATELENFPLAEPWNILDRDNISSIVSKLNTEDCFSLKETYPESAISDAIKDCLSKQTGLYLMLDHYAYAECNPTRYGFNRGCNKKRDKLGFLPVFIPKTPLIPPLEDFKLNEQKFALSYRTLTNNLNNNLQQTFPAVRTLKLVCRAATAERMQDFCEVLLLFGAQLESLQLLIGEQNSPKDPNIAQEIRQLFTILNTESQFPKLKHLFLDVYKHFWYANLMENSRTFFPCLSLLGVLEEVYLHLEPRFIQKHYELLQSNDNLKKLGTFPYWNLCTTGSLTGSLIDFLARLKPEDAKKVVFASPWVVCVKSRTLIVERLHLFTALTHFSFSVVLGPGETLYLDTLNALKDLQNLRELDIRLGFEGDDDNLQRPPFQLLRLPHVKVLNLWIIKPYLSDAFLMDHNIFMKLYVTQQFFNLQSLGVHFEGNKCFICKCELGSNENLNCYTQLIQPVTHFDHLEKFNQFSDLEQEFKDADAQILLTIKNRQEAAEKAQQN